METNISILAVVLQFIFIVQKIHLNSGVNMTEIASIY